ncbi:MAG: chemotaxis-specific protein-glutamate methyltransferase CheB [Deltaproteobacteria bacterium]|nr:chemotaxis-specific protein-glutamate methyltransferase CheB [Deltaproteobacteria bacterium]
MTDLIMEVLQEDPDIEVVGNAHDGESAVKKCLSLKPDVVTMDMILPVMSGLQATEQIMAFSPCPILIVSSSFNRAELFSTYQALAAGALELVEKPLVDEDKDKWALKLRKAIKLISKIKVITHLRAKFPGYGESVQKVPQAYQERHTARIDYIAIGASTGGPGAVLRILQGLPSDFSLPIFMVIHIGAPFGASFAEWLNSQSPIPVQFPQDGQTLPLPGKPGVFLAPPDTHMILDGGKIRLTTGPERNSCRPSVDVLFETMASELKQRVAAFLLTGMGADGARGLLDIRRKGGLTVAQDEQSSVIFGMPKEAIRLGAAQHVLSLNEMAPTLLSIESTFTRKVKRL